MVQVGELVNLTVGPVAHGGHCVARHDGQVVFVRHTLPGEEIQARITSVGAKFLRADAIGILSPSADRVPAPCPFSGPDQCGGCDWQHVELAAQRRLKASVMEEQLRRLAKIERSVTVEAVPGDSNGLKWRTRTTFAVSDEGKLGLRKHRSHDVVAISHCPISTDGVNDSGVFQRPWSEDVTVEVVHSSLGDTTVVVHEEKKSHVVEGPARVREKVGEFEFSVHADGFWQVHPGAAATLTNVVMSYLAPKAGDHIIDLYGGAGLFAAPLADVVGNTGRIDMVEGDRGAISDARRLFTDREWVRVHEGDVLAVLRMMRWRECQAVVLDPPRTGAGEAVVKEIARTNAEEVVYVACDPAALARDLAYFAEVGYRLDDLRVFDLFPMTHHMEAVAKLSRQ